MRTTQTDRANAPIPDQIGEAVRNAIDPAISAYSRFVETLILYTRDKFEIGGPAERNAMFGNVGRILGRVEFDLHMITM